jgi:hypothetical protein
VWRAKAARTWSGTAWEAHRHSPRGRFDENALRLRPPQSSPAGDGSIGTNHSVQIIAPAAGSDICPGGFYLWTTNFDDNTNNYSLTNMAVSFVIP